MLWYILIILDSCQPNSILWNNNSGTALMVCVRICCCAILCKFLHVKDYCQPPKTRNNSRRNYITAGHILSSDACYLYSCQPNNMKQQQQQTIWNNSNKKDCCCLRFFKLLQVKYYKTIARNVDVCVRFCYCMFCL